MSSGVESKNGFDSASSTRIEVLVVEDRPVSRAAARQLLGEHLPLERLADADDLEKALRISREFKPAVTLVNQLRENSAISIAKAVRQESPTTDILFVSMQESWIALASAIQAGVKGFVLESDPPYSIIDAVNTLHSGYAYFSPPIALMFAKAYSSNTQGLRITNLSGRELEILKHIGRVKATKRWPVILTSALKR